METAAARRTPAASTGLPACRDAAAAAITAAPGPGPPARSPRPRQRPPRHRSLDRDDFSQSTYADPDLTARTTAEPPSSNREKKTLRTAAGPAGQTPAIPSDATTGPGEPSIQTQAKVVPHASGRRQPYHQAGNPRNHRRCQALMP